MEWLHKPPMKSSVKTVKNGLPWNQCGIFLRWTAHNTIDCKKEAKSELLSNTKNANVAALGHISDMNRSEDSLTEEAVWFGENNIEISAPLCKQKSKKTKRAKYASVDEYNSDEGKIDSE